MHKKICPRGDNTAQSLTFTLPVAGIEQEVPLRAKRTLDAYAQSEVIICYSDHLGTDRLLPTAKQIYGYDEDDEEIRDVLDAMVEGRDTFQYARVTSRVEPSVMRLNPGEAAFNIEKYGEVIRILLRDGIITDTGKEVQIGRYSVRFPICRIHAQQTETDEDLEKRREQQLETLEYLSQQGFTQISLEAEVLSGLDHLNSDLVAIVVTPFVWFESLM